MANRRTFWACEGLGTADHGAGGTMLPSDYTYVPGVQSLGMSTNFNLEQIFQLGMLQIYQDLEEVPDIELTVERVMDQYALFYRRCMNHPVAIGATTIVADQDNQVDIGFVVGDSRVENIGDAAGPIPPGLPVGGNIAFAYMSGMFVSSVNFNFDTDGYFTESVTLVGNHKKWANAPGAQFNGAPVLANFTGNVAKRQKFHFATGGRPGSLTGGIDQPVVGDLAVSTISVSCDLGREEMNILGQRQPYHRFVSFPVEVTCDIEAYVTDLAQMHVNASPESDNTDEQTIKFHVRAASVADVLTPPAVGLADNNLHTFDLGSKNRLQSVTWNGIDTGGTNATITYSYRNFNTLTVTTADAWV
jgi:hypothetical protein